MPVLFSAFLIKHNDDAAETRTAFDWCPICMIEVDPSFNPYPFTRKHAPVKPLGTDVTWDKEYNNWTFEGFGVSFG